MSEIKLAVPAVQGVNEKEESAASPGADELRQLTELELVLAGGGEDITPWP